MLASGLDVANSVRRWDHGIILFQTELGHRKLPAVYAKYCAPVRRSPDVLNTFSSHFSLQPSHPTPVTIILWTPIFISAVHYPLSHLVSARHLTGHDDSVARLNANLGTSAFG